MPPFNAHQNIWIFLVDDDPREDRRNHISNGLEKGSPHDII